MKKRIAALPLWVAVAAPALLGQEAPDMAQLQAEIAAAQSAGDNAWMLVCCALVLMMTGPGLLLFYGGLVRRKNVLGTMMQCFILMAVISVLWAVVGYSLAFAEGNVFVGGLDHVFLRGVGMEPSGYAGTIPHYTFMLFQLMFAIITPALITGAFAERMKFSAMLLFMVLWSLVVYAPLAHMVWGSGGLLGWGGTIPAFDFAGGTVVHISSGVSALVCALYLKGRLGYGKVPMPPHSVVLSIIGACLLWVGWFGFNAGSALNAGGLSASAFAATHFATAAAVLGWVLAEWLRNGKPGVLGAITGAVAGLVAITPAAGFVTPMAAIFIGFSAGVICYLFVGILKHRLGYDDSLDAFGVHGVGGTLGALLTGVFATTAVNADLPHGGLVDGNPAQILNQAGAVLITWALAAVGTLILLKVVDLLIGVRVSEADEVQGLDITQHGEQGYVME